MATCAVLLSLALGVLISGCSLQRSAAAPRWIVVGTTQDVIDSGLSDALGAAFTRQEPTLHVKWLPTNVSGTITDPSNGYDVLLTRDSPDLNQIAGTPLAPTPTIRSDPLGNAPLPTYTPMPPTTPTVTRYRTYFGGRNIVFYSPAVLVGPPSDPQDLRSAASASKALKKIGQQNGPFLSPGRESGLQLVETQMWILVGTGELKLRGSAYQTLKNADAIETLRQAEASGAYTITPLATFLLSHDPAKSAIIKEDTALILPYEAALPNAAQRPDYDPQPTQSFVAFMFSQSTQEQIAAFGSQKAPFNRPLFYPATFAGFEPPH